MSLVTLFLLSACRPPAPPTETPGQWLPPSTGPVTQTLLFRGDLEAREVARIAVRLQGSATLEFLVPEDAPVQPGDLVARFDSAQIEQELARQENEVVRARQEYDSLRLAELPLELLDLESQLQEAREALDGEKAFTADARALLGQNLFSPAELERQVAREAAAAALVSRLETRLSLTRDHLHAARLAKAAAALDAAVAQRDFTARQLSLCEIRAPASGYVSRVPLTVSGAFRSARVGDTLYKNQVFLCMPLGDSFVIRGFASETDLAFLRPGARVTATPDAFPSLRLTGTVESVASMAQSRPGFPVWQKFFPVCIALDPLPDGHSQNPLPAGLSVTAEITVGSNPSALRVPRAAVVLRPEGPSVLARPADLSAPPQWLPVATGLADADFVELLAPLPPNHLVHTP